MRRSLLFLVLASMAYGGCQCSDPDGVKPPWDNTQGSLDGGGGRDGGGGGGGGGGDGGTLPFDPDAGSTLGVDPGQYQLDGGGLADTGGDNVQTDNEGNIILGGGRTELSFAWIANNDNNTVSKFDTRPFRLGDGGFILREVGRYHAAIPIDGRPRPDGGIGYPNGLRGNEGHNPSRTAVDLYGDVWVANRAANVQGSVTKIANNRAFCQERNGIPGIQTSEDRNGDGIISTVPDAGEMIIPSLDPLSADWTDPTKYDECILFSTPVGPPGTGTVKARAMAISEGIEGSAGDVWVGVHNDNSIIKLDPVTGQQVPVNAAGQLKIPLPFGPYGAAIDSQQRLWVVSSSLGRARLALINTYTGTVIHDNITPPTTSGAYGIAVDGKDRVWVAGWTSGVKAFRYTHPSGMGSTLGTWAEFDFANAVSQINTKMKRPRGIAADDQGFIWMSSDVNSANGSASQLISFHGDDGGVKGFAYPGSAADGGVADGGVAFIDATIPTGTNRTFEAIGVGLDTDGHALVNNRSGNAIRIDRQTGEILRTGQQNAGLYTYSDFTGYQLRNFTAPQGTYRQTFVSPDCGIDTIWRYVVWDATVPPKTSIQVFVTVSNDINELTNPALRKGPFTTSPADLAAAGVPKGRYLRVEFVLKSDDLQNAVSPKLKSFDVNYECEIIIQ
jgi:streptogramin lyase